MIVSLTSVKSPAFLYNAILYLDIVLSVCNIFKAGFLKLDIIDVLK